MHVMVQGTGSDVARHIRRGYDSDSDFRTFADSYAHIVGTCESASIKERFFEAMKRVDAWIDTLG